MKYLKTYESLSDVIGTTALTPYVGAVKDNVRTVFASASKFGDTIELISDGSDYFKVKEGSTVETVDLGLPSGTKWMKYNIGSTTEEGYGKYFQWGDTVGYTGTDAKSHSTWSTTPFNNGSSNYSSTYFATVSGTVTTDGILINEYDAVYVATNGEAHMPTKAQIDELTANTTTSWETLNEINGMRFTSKVDKTKSIFIPAAGDAFNGSLIGIGVHAYVWSSSLRTDSPNNAWYLDFYSGNVKTNGEARKNGYSLRGVVG